MATIAAATTDFSPTNISGGGGLHSPWVQVVLFGSDSSSSSENNPPPINISPPLPPQQQHQHQQPILPSPPDSSHPPAPADQPPSTSSDTSSAAVECPDQSNVVTVSKKPAWNKPSNAAYDSSSCPVMGADSWPSLSECTRPAPKSSSDASGGPIAVSQAPNSQPKPISTPEKPNSATSNPPPPPIGRQRSIRRVGGGGGGGAAAPNRHNNGHGRSPQISHPHPTATQMYHQVTQTNASHVPPPVFPSAPLHSDHGLTAAFPSCQTQTVNDHPMHTRGSSRRPNFGHHHAYRDGPHNNHHHHHGVRRDHNNRLPNGLHNAPDWNRRVFYGHPRHAGGGSGRGSSTLPTGGQGPTFPGFVPQPGGRFYAYLDHPGQLFYYARSGSEQFGNVHISSPGPLPLPPGPPHYPVIMPLDHAKSLSILKQIEYYFSDENLVKDQFLRSNMDTEGWVALSLIASFRRIRNLNADIPLLLIALASSNVVEVQDYRIRRRDGWMRWVPTSFAGNSCRESAHDELAASLKKTSLVEEAAANTATNQASTNEALTGLRAQEGEGVAEESADKLPAI